MDGLYRRREFGRGPRARARRASQARARLTLKLSPNTGAHNRALVACLSALLTATPEAS